jgi:type I restriction enzyme S subunit
MVAVQENGKGIGGIETRPFGEVRTGYTSFLEGDVLFAKITPCMQNGKHAVVRDLIDGVGFGSTEFHIVRPGSSILADWVHAYLIQPDVLAMAEAHFTGTVGQQRVPPSFLTELVIPLPPLPEQRRIAALLTEQMAAVERARAAAEAQLGAATALKAACLREVFESEEAMTWQWYSLGAASTVTGGIQKTPQRKPTSFHRPFLTVRNVQRGALDLTNVEQFEVTPEELARYRLEPGDILLKSAKGNKGVIA